MKHNVSSQYHLSWLLLFSLGHSCKVHLLWRSVASHLRHQCFYHRLLSANSSHVLSHLWALRQVSLKNQGSQTRGPNVAKLWSVNFTVYKCLTLVLVFQRCSVCCKLIFKLAWIKCLIINGSLFRKRGFLFGKKVFVAKYFEFLPSYKTDFAWYFVSTLHE